jgi:Asp-tRNA(Asn)/Glu-tRNA(Gln) amidotransferase A subunit family amidase
VAVVPGANSRRFRRARRDVLEDVIEGHRRADQERGGRAEEGEPHGRRVREVACAEADARGQGGYLADVDAGVDGLRIAVIKEGFGIPGLSQPSVDETVRAAIGRLAAAGAAVTDVSLPWHRDGLHVWNVIATDGATSQMIDGNGYGMNSAGLYDPELIAHYANGRREHAAEMSESLKLTALCGRYANDRYGGWYYAMARTSPWT